MKTRSVARVALAIAALGIATFALWPAAASATDRYGLANGCYAVRTIVGSKYVQKSGSAYTATGTTLASATPFRMQATALGRYLLYGPDGSMPAVGLLNQVTSTTTPGPDADWTLDYIGQAAVLRSHKTGQGIRSGTGGKLGLVAGSNAEGLSFIPAQGCSKFPEVEVNVSGTPLKGSSPTAKVRGFLDDHIHLGAFQFLGGRFHCGRPWSPYGVTVALEDCNDHQPNGAAAVVENFISTGSPVGTHNTEGWPSFAGWPRDESQTHEGTYWKWIERAWRSGLRIMVNDLVENRALCELYPYKQNNCNEMVSAYQQAKDMRALQDYIDAQFGGPGKGFFRLVSSSTEARKVINAGKLAVVLGVEVSEVLDCGQFNGTPKCDAGSIDLELDKLYGIGVRSLFPVHKFDNALGGTKFDSGGTGVLVNTGNKWVTGQFWTADHCDDPDHDNTPTPIGNQEAQLVYTLFGPVLTQPLFQGQLPVYPPGPHCNPKGLTALGEHLIRSMMRKGMIVETDHMSMKARRQTLSILEASRYPGVIASHSWGDPGSQKRLQKLGGIVGPISSVATSFAQEWSEARALRDSRFFFGTGFGSDINGLHSQPKPRANAAQNPVRYPFRSFDGGTLIDRQRSGTRLYDVNADGVDHYGLYPDWIEDLRMVAGQQIVTDMANGAEAYLQMWARAEAAAQ
ncbi:MAG TPA: membrane dipeptidase [Thermoleophilaceae bacterium]|nr:membrane dipeptidase [Thermoleophilaceae bacterium]